MAVGLVPRQAMPGRVALAAIALVTAAFAVVFGRIPWPRIDLANAMQRAVDLSWADTIRAAFGSGVEYRPVMTIATKAAYSVGGLHLWFYKTLVLIEFAGVLWMLGAAAWLSVRTNFLNFIALPITFGIGCEYPFNIFDRSRLLGGDVTQAVKLHLGAVTTDQDARHDRVRDRRRVTADRAAFLVELPEGPAHCVGAG